MIRRVPSIVAAMGIIPSLPARFAVMVARDRLVAAYQRGVENAIRSLAEEWRANEELDARLRRLGEPHAVRRVV